MRLRTVDLVIDVDPRNFAPGDDPVRRLETALDVRLENWPRVVTGSGGDHYYMTVPEGFLASDSLADYQGIEFKGHGRQVVAPGSSHPDTRQPYLWDDDPLGTPFSADVRMAPERLLDLIRRPEPSASVEAGSVTAEQLESMLHSPRWRANNLGCARAWSFPEPSSETREPLRRRPCPHPKPSSAPSG